MSVLQQEFKWEQATAQRRESPQGRRVGVYHVELVRDRSIEVERGTVIDTSGALVKIVARELAGADREKLLCLWLNARHRVVGVEVVSVGTLTASLAHAREVFKGAILRNAASIVIAHNHPSGDPRPSTEDMRLTKRLAEAGRLLGIELLEHLIWAEEGVYSFRSEGAL
jgi:DNA repair protein RadC